MQAQMMNCLLVGTKAYNQQPPTEQISLCGDIACLG